MSWTRLIIASLSALAYLSRMRSGFVESALTLPSTVTAVLLRSRGDLRLEHRERRAPPVLPSSFTAAGMTMVFGGLFKRLFTSGGEVGSTEPDRSKAVEYKGLVIIPMPRPHGGQFLTAALIEKPAETGTLIHELVRADTHSSAEEAGNFAVQKAKQVIDEQGDQLFAVRPSAPAG